MSISNIMSESYIKSLNPFEKKILAMETEFDIEFSRVVEGEISDCFRGILWKIKKDLDNKANDCIL